MFGSFISPSKVSPSSFCSCHLLFFRTKKSSIAESSGGKERTTSIRLGAPRISETPSSSGKTGRWAVVVFLFYGWSTSATPRTPLRKKGLRRHYFFAGEVGRLTITVGRFCPGNTHIDLKFNSMHLKMMVFKRNLLFQRADFKLNHVKLQECILHVWVQWNTTPPLRCRYQFYGLI